MSKNKNASPVSPSGATTHDPATHTSSAPLPVFTMPEGYTRRNTDIVGFWDGQAPIHFIPETAKAFDGKKYDKTKPSVLIIGTLVAACGGRAKDDEGEQTEIILQPGETVGVWGKAGMRDIRGCRGVKTIIIPTGKTKDVGKGEPMKLYDVHSEDGGRPLFVDEDLREKSLNTPHFLERGKRQTESNTSDNMGVPLDATGKPLF